MVNIDDLGGVISAYPNTRISPEGTLEDPLPGLIEEEEDEKNYFWIVLLVILAILAREFNIPTVAGVRNATEILHDNQVAVVNGTRGTVTILNQSS